MRWNLLPRSHHVDAVCVCSIQLALGENARRTVGFAACTSGCESGPEDDHGREPDARGDLLENDAVGYLADQHAKTVRILVLEKSFWTDERTRL